MLVLKGELVNEICREEPVCLKYSEGLVIVNLGARLPVLKGELVNKICREEPVRLKYSEGLVIVNVGARLPVLKGELVNEICREEPVCLQYSEGLVFINSRSSSACVEGRARRSEQLGSSSQTVGARLPVLKKELVNEICRNEPVCLKYSEGLVIVNVGARLPVLKGELVNEICMEEPSV